MNRLIILLLLLTHSFCFGQSRDWDYLVERFKTSVDSHEEFNPPSIYDTLLAHIDELNTEQKATFYFYTAQLPYVFGYAAAQLYYLKKAELEAEKLPNHCLIRGEVYMMKLRFYEDFKEQGFIYKEMEDDEKMIRSKLRAILPDIKKGNECDRKLVVAEYYRMAYSLDSAVLVFKEIIENNCEPSHISSLNAHTGLGITYATLANSITGTGKEAKKNRSLYLDSATQQLIKAENIAHDSITLAYTYLIHGFILSTTSKITLREKYSEKLDQLLKQIQKNRPNSVYLNNLNALFLRLLIEYKKAEIGISMDKHSEIEKLTNNLNAILINKQNREFSLNKYASMQILDLEESERRKLKAANHFKLTLVITLIAIMSILGMLVFYYKKQRSEYKYILALRERELAQQKLEKEKTRALMNGREKERKAIAQELHDEVANRLAGIKYNIGSIVARMKEHISLFEQPLTQMDVLYNSIRNLSHIIDMPDIQEHTFSSLVKNLVIEYHHPEKFIVEYSLLSEQELNTLHYELRRHLFLILQELLLNTRKHAQAQLVDFSIRVINEKKEVELFYYDNGVGIDLSNTDNPLPRLLERISLLNGSLDIDAEHTGLTVKVKIPIQEINDYQV